MRDPRNIPKDASIGFKMAMLSRRVGRVREIIWRDHRPFSQEIMDFAERIMQAESFEDLDDADKELILRAEQKIIDAGGEL